jgi:hypothetical protein
MRPETDAPAMTPMEELRRAKIPNNTTLLTSQKSGDGRVYFYFWRIRRSSQGLPKERWPFIQYGQRRIQRWVYNDL